MNSIKPELEQVDLNISPTWGLLFDRLKRVENIRSDAKLAESLEVTRGFICAIKKGRKSLPLEKVHQVFCRLGIDPTDDVLGRLFAARKISEFREYQSKVANREVS